MAQRARSHWMAETSQRRLRDEDPEKYFAWCLSYPYFRYGDGVEVEIALFAPGMSQWVKVENAVWTTIQETKEKHNLKRNSYMLSESSSGPDRDVFEEACKVVQDHPDFPRPRPQARENEKHFYHSKLPKILISHVNHKVMSMYADLQFGKKRKRTGEDPEHDKKDTMSAHKVKKPKDDQQLTPDNHHCPQPSVDQKHQQDPSVAIELKPAPVPELRLLVASSLSCVLRVKFSPRFRPTTR